MIWSWSIILRFLCVKLSIRHIFFHLEELQSCVMCVKWCVVHFFLLLSPSSTKFKIYLPLLFCFNWLFELFSPKKKNINSNFVVVITIKWVSDDDKWDHLIEMILSINLNTCDAMKMPNRRIYLRFAVHTNTQPTQYAAHWLIYFISGSCVSNQFLKKWITSLNFKKKMNFARFFDDNFQVKDMQKKNSFR